MDFSDTQQHIRTVETIQISSTSQTQADSAWQIASGEQSVSKEMSITTDSQYQNQLDSNFDDVDLLAERKQSQIQALLINFRKLDSQTERYKKMNQDSSELEQYERNTYLGKPPDTEIDKDKPVIEETSSEISMDNLAGQKIKEENKKNPRYYNPLDDNAFIVEEYDLLLQYVAGTEPIKILHEQMDIKNDIVRLTQLYLDANTKFKLSMPSENVENLLYEKIYFNICQQQPQMQAIGGSDSIRGSTQMQSTMQSSVAAPFGSVYSDKQFNNKSSSALMSDSSSSFSGFGNPASQNLSASNRNSTLSKNSQTKISPIIVRTEEKKIEQCTPYIFRMDSCDNNDKDVWQDLVDELRSNSVVSADILQLILDLGFNQEDGFDLSHRTMLVNLSQFFFDNIYQDDRLAYAETNPFLRIFIRFAKTGISQDSFVKDSIGQIQFKSDALRQMIECLFEGITRKIPAFNFLRFVYAGPFNRINMYQIDLDIRRMDPPKSNTDKSGKGQDQKDKNNEDKKPGFFKKFWGSVFEKKIDEKKKDEAKKGQVPIKEGDMDFEEESKGEEVKPSLNNGQPPKLFAAMTTVYGGHSDPFEQNSAEKDPSQLKRFEAIEQRIQEERVNSNMLVCQDKKYGFRPKYHDRIIMTEEEIRRQFENRASTIQKPDQPRAPAVKTKKDLTYYIKSLVQKNFEQMINFQQKIPFAIRAMLRIIIVRSRGWTDFNAKVSVESHEVALLAQILVGGWLNSGQRNPKCFGIQPTVEKELELEFIFFQASRITFEHLMMMQRIPDETKVDGFSVYQLNDMIKELSPQVFLFWIRLINVDISEVEKLPQESLIQQSVIRVKDLELLYTYCEKAFDKYKRSELVDKSDQFSKIMEKIATFGIQIEPEEDTSFADQIIFDSNTQKEKEKLSLVKPNRFYRNMSDYFQNLINLWVSVPSPFEQFEYYLMFMRKKNDQNLKKKFIEELQQTRDHIKASTQQFVVENLMQNGSNNSRSETTSSQVQGPNEQSSPDKLESPLPRILTAQVPSLTRHQQSVPNPQSLVSSLRTLRQKSVKFDTGAMQRLVRLSKLSGEQISSDKVTDLVINIFNTLKVVIKKKELVLETLKDNSSTEELRDLVQIFLQAGYSNNSSSNPDLYLQAGCQHLAFLFRKLNLEKQFSTQNELLRHFCKMLVYQLEKFKKLLDFFTISIQQFGSDMFRFEQNITNLKQFHKRFDNQLTFNKTISRYNPEVCLLSHSYELLDDFRYYKGVLLNLSCSNHQTGLPISSYMLFGVVRRSVANVLDQPIAVGSNGSMQPTYEMITISEEELTMKKVRDLRVSRYRDHHMAYTTVTVSLQNNNTMEVKPKDEPIKLIEAFIQFYTNKQKNNLRAMIRADEEKYRTIVPLEMVPDELATAYKECKNDKQKYEFLGTLEPYDFMNLLHTYIMFLEHISVMNSQNPKDDYIQENKTKVRQHYDFLRYDLQARTLRFSIHDYIMRRMHKTIFNQTKPFPKDELVQQLILEKQNDPDWVLTSASSQQQYQEYLASGDQTKKPKDFTDHPEWTNTHIYSSSLKTLLKIIDEETPHLKALYIDDAQACAIHSLRIAAPYEKGDKFDAELQSRVSKHLMVEVCKIYDKARTNSRLFSQLMFIHLFNIPVQEKVNWHLLYNNEDNYMTEKMFLKDQHKLYLEGLTSRNVAYDMFQIVKILLKEHYDKENLKANAEAEAKKKKNK